MKPPTTPADHIDRAADELRAGVPDYAQASALIAIAQILERTVPPPEPVIVRMCPTCHQIALGE